MHHNYIYFRSSSESNSVCFVLLAADSDRSDCHVFGWKKESLRIPGESISVMFIPNLQHRLC